MRPQEAWGSPRRMTDPTPILESGRPADLLKLTPIDLASWDGEPVPERRWIVEGMIPERNVTLLGGDGGLGKSLLALQLGVACALGGRPWIGHPTRPCRVLGYFCEDDEDELHRRLAPVLRHYGAQCSDVAQSLSLVSAVGSDNLLLEFPSPYEPGRPTALYHRIRETALEMGAGLILLDSLHDLFGGNENDRRHARQFVAELRKLALATEGAVFLTGHPSKDGRLTGSGEAGSTAWNNAVRSRLYLTAPRQDPEGEARDHRELKTMKANYAPAGGVSRIRWERGVFVEDAAGRPRGMVDALSLDRDLVEGLRALIENGALVPADPNARKGFANAVRELKSCKRYDWGIICAAQARLVSRGTLCRVEMGPPSRRRIYLRPADMIYPGELKGEIA
ncbi:MAG TPA: AAA family ATPase [Stellaceae bacterium]|nr:AAA family ATPase [Stellaceae bacterium]